MLIGDMARMSARRYKDQLAYKDERRELTYKQVNQRANALVHALYKMGLRKGDRIAVLLFNCVEYSELLFALPKGGFILVPLNYRLVGRELQYIIDNSEASALIFGDDFITTVEEIRSKIETVRHYIMIDRKGNSRTEALDYEKLVASHPDTELPVDLLESDAALILYTSGTTGHPKGVMLTHKNIVATICNHSFELKPEAHQKIFNLGPLYHIAGQTQSMIYPFFGCPHITIKQFESGLVLEKIWEEKPSVLMLVPAMLNMVVNHPDVGKHDYGCLELIVYGGASIMQKQLMDCIKTFGCRFIQFGGQTEGSGCLTCFRPEDHVVEGPENVVRRLRSAGKEARFTEVKIVDAEGNELPPDTPGEQIARGDNVMKGYWKMPEATAETILDGWLHTGDICMKDEEGFVYYVDRIKDMINRAGENVYPREIEEVIASHPSVMEVAVIGIPDERVGEEIMAVIVPKKGYSISEDEIIRLCENNLARYKKARRIQFVDELPKNASGKILKRALREKYGKSSQGLL